MLRALLEVARTPTLDNVLTSDAVLSLLDDEGVADALMALLPEGKRTREELVQTASSPHLRSALRALSRVLSDENFASVMANFQLRGGDAYLARGDGIGAFLEAISEVVESADAASEPGSERAREGGDQGAPPPSG